MRFSMNVHYEEEEEVPKVKKEDFGHFATVDIGEITLFFKNRERAEKFIKLLFNQKWEVKK